MRTVYVEYLSCSQHFTRQYKDQESEGIGLVTNLQHFWEEHRKIHTWKVWGQCRDHLNGFKESDDNLWEGKKNPTLK